MTRTVRILFSIVFSALCAWIHAQGEVFSNASGKWGVRKGHRVIIPPYYDTIFGFDPTGSVCLACHERISSSGSSFIKVKSTSYACNYLDTLNRKLVIRDDGGDTSSIFSLGRNAVKQYSHTGKVMTVSSKGLKHLVGKDFKQITFKGYYNIEEVEGAPFFRCETQSESEAVYSGVVSREERILVPFMYSSISVNTDDSLIIGCTAGFRGNDEVYDYFGRKVAGSPRHIAQASRQVLIEKNPGEPRRYFVFHRATSRTTELEADEILLNQEKVEFRKKKSWYSLNAATGEKITIKPPQR